MKTAFSYLRFSSKPQERGDSLRRQTELARKYADKHGYILDERSYADLGVSAFKGANVREGALGAFLQAVDEGVIRTPATLLVENLDRISRAEVDEALELFLSIIRRGITVVTLQDEQVYSKERIREDKGISLIVSITYMMRAHEESATKSKRVRAAWDAKRAKGEILTAMAPPWLRLSEDRKKWLIVKEQAKKVHTIFDLAKDGYGTPTIARKLNDSGISPFAAEHWTNGTVAHVLKNRAVIGTYTPKKADALPVEGYYPAVIDEALFWSVQDGMKSRKWKGGSNTEEVRNLFTGFAFCAHCGSRMKYVSSSKPNYYLQCSKSYSRAGCDGVRHPYRELQYEGIERQVLVWLLMDQEKAFPHLEVESDTGSKVVLEGTRAMKKEQLDRAIELQLAGSRRAASEIVRLENEIDELTEALRKYEKPANEDRYKALNDTIRMVLDLNIEENEEKRNRMRMSVRGSLQRLVERVEFYNDIRTGRDTIYKPPREIEERRVVVKFKDTEERHDIWYQLPPFGINGTRRRQP